MNDQPQLEIQLRVDTADGRTFPATMREVVDLTDLSAVQPNAILPVRYLSDGRVALATDSPTPRAAGRARPGARGQGLADAETAAHHRVRPRGNRGGRDA